MSQLNFPTDGLYEGYQYVGDNGVTYIWDGVKWIGHSSALPPGTSALVNNGNIFQVDSTGNLVAPNYVFPATSGTTNQVLVWPASGNTLEWAEQTGTGGGTGNGWQLTSSTAVVSLNADGILSIPNRIAPIGNYGLAISPTNSSNSNLDWNFNANGKVSVLTAPASYNSVQSSIQFTGGGGTGQLGWDGSTGQTGLPYAESLFVASSGDLNVVGTNVHIRGGRTGVFDLGNQYQLGSGGFSLGELSGFTFIGAQFTSYYFVQSTATDYFTTLLTDDSVIDAGSYQGSLAITPVTRTSFGMTTNNKYVFQIKINRLSVIGNTIGVITGSGDFTQSLGAANFDYSVGFESYGGYNGPEYPGAPQFGVDDYVIVAVDRVNHKIWIKVLYNEGSDGQSDWNSDPTADPATNTGGFDLPTFGGAAIYPAVTSVNGNNYIDLGWTFGSDGVLTLPSGNTRIGDIGGGGVSDFIIGSTGTLLGVVTQGAGGAGALQWVGNFENLGTTSTQLAAVIVNNPFASTTGTVQILTGVSTGTGSSNIWEFSANGNLLFPSGAYLIADSQDGTYLQANPGVDGYAGISNLTGSSWMWTANDGGAYISSGGTWSFNTNSNLNIPGDIQDANGSVIRVATTSTSPTRVDGQLWYNSEEGRTYVKYNDQWVDASPTVIPPPETYLDELAIDGSDMYDANGSVLRVAAEDLAPTREDGQLWFDTVEGRAYIKYNDQWVEFSPTDIPPPSTYLDDIEIDGSTLYINNSTLTIDATGTLLVNGAQVTGGGSGWQLTSSTTVVSLTSDGILTLPNGSTISAPEGGAIRLHPSGASTSTQALVIYPTAVDGNHIHLTAGGGTTDLYLGNDSQYVKVDNSGTVVIGTLGANTSTWTFGTDGSTTFPNDTILGTGLDPNVYIETLTTATTSTWTFGTNGILTLPAATPVIKGGGTGTDVTIVATTGSNTSTWTFAADGSLTLPTNGAQIIGGVIWAEQLRQTSNKVAIGEDAGANTQSSYSVAIGPNAGQYSQGIYNVALGLGAGRLDQANGGTALGAYAGSTRQGEYATAVGMSAGGYEQGTESVAIGRNAGNSSQGGRSIAIGLNAGQNDQGEYAVAIGYLAGEVSQSTGTIIINASGIAVNGVSNQQDSLYITPIRNASGTSGVLQYNTSTKEVSYSNTITVNTSAWTFGADGGLTFPDSTVQTTAYVPATASASTYTGWFQPAETVVQLDTLLARINSTGTMQISTTIVETEPTGAAFAWNGVRNKGATMSAFGQGGENWVNPGDWLDISATPLDNDFEVATVSVFKLGGTGNLYRITYVGSTSGGWAVNIERVALGSI